MSGRKKRQILILEQDAVLADIYKRALEKVGFAVRIAEHGAAGLEAIRKKRPHLVILDVLLPHVDGFEVLETIRSDSKTEGIPVIVLSDAGERADVERAFGLGITEYFLKRHADPARIVALAKNIIL